MKPKQYCQNCLFMIRENDAPGGSPPSPCCCNPRPAELTEENLLFLIRDLQRQIDQE